MPLVQLFVMAGHFALGLLMLSLTPCLLPILILGLEGDYPGSDQDLIDYTGRYFRVVFHFLSGGLTKIEIF